MNSFQSRVLSFLLGACAAVVMVFAYRLWLDVNQGFPRVASGRYIGTIRWGGDEATPEYFLLEVKNDKYSFSLAASSYDLTGMNVSYNGRFVGGGDLEEGYYPLQIQGADRSFVLHGGYDEGRVLGSITEINSGDDGSWSLQPLGKAEPEQRSDSELRLALIQEEKHLTQRLQERDEERGVLIETVTALDDRIASRDGLRSEAKERYSKAEAKLNEIRSARTEESQALKKIATQLNLAKDVTRYGEVVSLARRAAQLDERAFLKQEGYGGSLNEN